MPINLNAPLRAGQLRTRVTIQVNSAAGTQDSRGEEVETWTTYCQGSAAVEPVWLGSKELSAAEQVQANQWYLVLMRYRAGVKPKMRLSYGNHILDIQAVMDPDQRRHRMILRCLERVAVGTA